MKQEAQRHSEEIDGLVQGLELRFCLDELVARQAPRARADWLVTDLKRLLASAGAAKELGEQIAWLEQAARWLRARRSGFGGGAPGALSSARLRLMLEALRELPRLRETVSLLAEQVLSQMKPLRLFAETGLPTEQGFLGEACDRLVGKCLPVPPDELDLAQLVARLFPERADADWLDELAPDLAAEVAEVLGLKRSQALRSGMGDALAVLGLRVSAIGLAADVRARTAEIPLADNPFVKLPRACDWICASLRGRGETREAAATACRAALAQCRWAIASVHERLEESGVSVDLVWRLERASRILDRMSALLAALCSAGSAELPAGLQLASALVRERLDDLSLRSLLRSSLHKLSRKVIERAGKSGEHYITTTRAGWHAMVSSAAGGGLLTAFTVALKFGIAGAALPIFFDGLASSLNYAGSFLLMQLFGSTLATKQPAMTAAALASAMSASPQRRGIDAVRLVSLIARITRSQLAAIIGNLGMVVPAALALDAVSRLVSGHPFLDAEAAHHVVDSLHPTRSATAIFAALTGCELWLTSLGAGWMENWIVFHRLPEAVAGSRKLRAMIGAARAEKLAKALAQNAAGVGGSLTLGALLGMVPALGRFFGVPLESRHVTLMTGALALAACAMGPTHLGAAFLAAVAGIAVIALCNFGVSFSLALGVALRGREATREERLSVVRALLGELRRRPLSFVLPPPR